MNQVQTKKRNITPEDNISNKKPKSENEKLISLNKYCEKIKDIDTKTSDARLDQYNKFETALNEGLEITKSLNERLIEKENIRASNEHLETLQRNLTLIFQLFISRHLSSLKNTLTRQIKEISDILFKKLKEQPNENINNKIIEINEDQLNTSTSYLLQKRQKLKEKSHVRDELFTIIDQQTNQEREIRLDVFDHVHYYNNGTQNLGKRLRILGEELVTENSDIMEVLSSIQEAIHSLFSQLRKKLFEEPEESYINDVKYFIETLEWALAFETHRITEWTHILLNQITKIKENRTI